MLNDIKNLMAVVGAGFLLVMFFVFVGDFIMNLL